MAVYPPTIPILPSIFNPDEFYKFDTGVGSLAEVLAEGNDGNNLGIVSGGAIGCSSITTPFGFINALETTTITDIATTGVSIDPTGTLKIKGATTKGSLLVGDGTNTIELPTATNGLVLKTNSGTASGLEWGADGAGVTSITAGLNIGVDSTISSAPAIRVLNPLTSTLNLGSQAITGTTGYINFATASPSSEAQMSASLGFTAYDSITTNIASTLSKTGLSTQTGSDNINVTPTGITKSVGATTLGITSNTSSITLTPLAANDCDVVVSGAGKLHIQQSTTGGQINPLCRLTNTNATGSVALEVYKNKPTASVGGDVLFNQSVYGKDGGNNKQEYTRITHSVRDNTSGAEDGSMEMSCFVNGSVNTFLQLNGNENEVNCLKTLDMGGNNIRTNTGNLTLDATSSTGTGNITLSAKSPTGKIQLDAPNYVNVSSAINVGSGTGYNFIQNDAIDIFDTSIATANTTATLGKNSVGFNRLNTLTSLSQSFSFDNDSASGGVINYQNTIGTNGIVISSNRSIELSSVAGLFFLTNLPTSSSGLPTGALWNNSGVLNIA